MSKRNKTMLDTWRAPVFQGGEKEPSWIWPSLYRPAAGEANPTMRWEEPVKKNLQGKTQVGQTGTDRMAQGGDISPFIKIDF